METLIDEIVANCIDIYPPSFQGKGCCIMEHMARILYTAQVCSCGDPYKEGVLHCIWEQEQGDEKLMSGVLDYISKKCRTAAPLLQSPLKFTR
jgi:hypothetical protein